VQWGIAQPDVTYHAYWKQDVVQTGNEDHIVSLWTRPGTALLQVFNLVKGEEPARVKISFDREKLGLGETFTIYDLESAPAVAGLKEKLAQYDAGQIEGGRPLLKNLQSMHEPNFDLSDLEQVGDADGSSVKVPPRDFRLLVINPGRR
jgi:hypothetical protein